MPERRIVEIYNQLASIYDEAFQDPDSLRENSIVSFLLNLLIQKRDSVLDLGCGTGLFLQLFPHESYVGVDLAEKMLHKARSKFPKADFRLCNMENLSDSQKFDVIVSLFGSITYAYPAKTVEAIKRASRKGSRLLLIFYVPDYRKRTSYILNVYQRKDGYFELTQEDLADLYRDFDPVILKLGWFNILYGVKQ